MKKTALKTKSPRKRSYRAKKQQLVEKQALKLPQDEEKKGEAVPEAGEKIQITGQFIAARTMAMGGIRVSIDIPEALVKDCAIASTLALQRQWARITVEDYEKKESPTGKKRKPGAPTD